MIVLAYDGSLNGDWVSRYAIRMAAALPEPSLRAIHIRDGGLSPEQLEAKLERLESECRSAGVSCLLDLRHPAGHIHDALLAALPTRTHDVIVCGTRVRSRNQGLLRGSLAERLLRQRASGVMAVRVVQPGLLGNAHRLLVPLSGNPRNIQGAWPFLRLLLPRAQELRVLRVMPVSESRLAGVTSSRHAALRDAGLDTVNRALAELRRGWSGSGLRLDARVAIANEWANEVLVQANLFKAQLIVMGASERTLPGRILQGNPLEHVLREAPCDVAICRS